MNKYIEDNAPLLIASGITTVVLLAGLTFYPASAQKAGPDITKQNEQVVVSETVQTIVDLVELQAEIDSLRLQKTGLEGQIETIQARILDLTTQIASKENLKSSIISKFPEEEAKLTPQVEEPAEEVQPVAE